MSGPPFKLILADPPWVYNDTCDAGSRGAAHKYPLMSLAHLKRLQVLHVAARDCVLLMWATGPLMSEALELIKAWRFNYKTIGFTWVKTTQAGKPSMGMGHYSRSNAEVVLLGTRGNPGVEVVDSQLCLLATVGSPKVVSHSVNQVIIAPRGEHSAKPPDVHSRAVELLGDVPRLEMFARAQVPGWVCWGHDVGVDVNDKLPRMGQLF